MTDPLDRAVAVADLLRARRLPATDDNLDAALKTLQDLEQCEPANWSEAGIRALQQRDAALRAASSTQRLDDDVKASRLRDLEAEHVEIDEYIAARRVPRLTAADLADYGPPDPYAAGIKALQQKEARR